MLDDLTLTSASVLVGVLVAAATAFVSYREYRLKARVDRAETDIKLARLFTELIPIANGRGQSAFSEAAITALTQTNPDWSADDLDRAVVTYPVGTATQGVAIASIGYLGATYKELREPAAAALNGLAYLDAHPHLGPIRRKASESLIAGTRPPVLFGRRSPKRAP